MATACILILFRTGKNSEATIAVSTVLVLMHPMDVSIQRLSRADPPKYGSALTMICSFKNFPIHATNSISVTCHQGRGSAVLHELLAKFLISSCQPISPAPIAVCSLPHLLSILQQLISLVKHQSLPQT